MKKSVSIFAYTPFLLSSNHFNLTRLKLSSYSRKTPIVQTRFRGFRMYPAQKIFLLLPHKRLLPLLADIIQHLQRIIITIPAPGLHELILGRQKTHLFPDFPLHGLQGSFSRINPSLGKLPSPFLSGTFANQQFSVLPNNHPHHIGTIQSFHGLLTNTVFRLFPVMFKK